MERSGFGARMGIVLVLILLTALTACKDRGGNMEAQEFFIYYLNSEENQLVKEPVRIMSNNLEEQLEVLVSGLDRKPKDITHKKAKKDYISVLDYTLIDKKLTMYFNASYMQLTGVREILCRAAIVKTLCQLNGVDYVEFKVDGEPLKTSKEKVVGLMSEKDFIDNMTGESIYRQNINISMYFSNMEGDRLVEFPITILFDGTIPLEQLIIQQLLQGPEAISGMEEEKAKSTLPKGTKLNQVSVKDRVAYVDFSSEFMLPPADVKNEVILYSVVNVLVELPTVDKVQFLIDGNVVENYGELDFDVAMERNLDIVEQTD